MKETKLNMQRSLATDSPPVRDPKRYKCSQCTKAFANSSYLTQHTRIHLGIKPYLCEICQRSFTQLSHLQQHIRTHTGDKPYKCPEPGCSKAFSQLSNLHSHSRCHQTDKPFKCNSCHKCFSDEPSLIAHIPKHRESKHLKTHICQYCGKSYTQEVLLAKHMQKHADRLDKVPPLSGSEPSAVTNGEVEGYSALDLQSYWHKVTSDFASASTESANGEGTGMRLLGAQQFGEHRLAANHLRDLLEQGVNHRIQDSGGVSMRESASGENLVTHERDASERDTKSNSTPTPQPAVSGLSPSTLPFTSSSGETPVTSHLPPFQSVTGMMHLNHLVHQHQHVTAAQQVMPPAPQYLSYVAIPIPQHGVTPSTVGQFSVSPSGNNDLQKSAVNTFPNQLISLQQIKNYSQQPQPSSLLVSERLLGIKEEGD